MDDLLAALHSLNNNPTLLTLRLVQALEQSSGNTVVMGLPPQP
jgi:hypothetical protein